MTTYLHAIYSIGLHMLRLHTSTYVGLSVRIQIQSHNITIVYMCMISIHTHDGMHAHAHAPTHTADLRGSTTITLCASSTTAPVRLQEDVTMPTQSHAQYLTQVRPGYSSMRTDAQA
jgi:hypothetical protein